MIKNERSLRVREMTPDEVGQKIAKHCKGHKLIFTVKVTKDNTEQTALRIIKDRKCMYIELNFSISCAYLRESQVSAKNKDSISPWN